VDRVYDEGNYDLVLRYGQRLSTPLNAEDAAWAARQAPA